ncbi:MAG TPA: bile acid:sodium symporter [Trueperaceae bacterium]|nr:bile acid:sodium symporter [Trueperaceae bacterium]
MPRWIPRASRHLQKYLLGYSLLAIAVGWSLGLVAPMPSQAVSGGLAHATTVLVFLMIYPMMINLDLSVLPRAFREPRPVLMSLLYNFVLTPILSLGLVWLLIHDSQLALGFLLVMLIPGSSMSVAYAGLAEGSLEVATVALAANFLLVPFLLPLLLHILSRAYSVTVPLGQLLTSIALVLILPMVVAAVTRWGIIRTRGQRALTQAKPLFGLATMGSMLVTVGLIFFMKGRLLLGHWTLLIPLLAATLIYLAIILPLITWLDRRVGISYGDHMGIAFLSTGKNNGTAIAIAVLAFSPLVAIPAATLPLFQIVFLVGYVNLAPRVRAYFGRRASGSAPESRPMKRTPG